jgi:hypothetical protein
VDDVIAAFKERNSFWSQKAVRVGDQTNSHTNLPMAAVRVCAAGRMR